jgi:hypothetical protein
VKNAIESRNVQDSQWRLNRSFEFAMAEVQEEGAA